MASDTGAGDALLAGFIIAQRNYKTPDRQLKFAMACAAITLEATHAVSTKITEQFVSSRFEAYLQTKTNHAATAESEI
jgi:pseudouridine kinase